MATFEPEFLAHQDPFQDVLELFRLSILPFLFICHDVPPIIKALPGIQQGFINFI
jgi:hypothetical protein